jgi:hypothetical protein
LFKHPAALNGRVYGLLIELAGLLRLSLSAILAVVDGDFSD